MASKEARFYNDIVCIGGGLSAIALGAHAKITYGITDIHFYERHASMGGTWWINTYPGAACDVPSALYSFSFSQKPNWTCLMPSNTEIIAYADEVAAKYDIPARATLQTEVVKAEWLEDRSRWRVYLRDLVTGEEYTHECKILFSATGQLGVPNYPELPGQETFQGKIFHSARWDHAVELDGKRVAVVGNGCTATQIVPSIMPRVASMHQFIRSKHWIQKAPTFPYNAVFYWMFKHVPLTLWLHRFTVFLVAEWDVRLQMMDPWSVQQRKWKARAVEAYMRKTAPEKYHEQLIPDFEIGCKRRILDTGYLASLNDPKAHLISDPILSLTPEGIRTANGDVPVDVIVLATGFQTNRFLQPVQVVGRAGETLEEHWAKAGGPGAYNTTAIRGFPNFFFLLGPNSATGHTSALMASENVIGYALNVASPVLRREATTVEVKEPAEKSYIKRVQEALENTVFSTGCGSWYVRGGRNAMLYPWTQAHFLYRCSFVKWDDWDVNVSVPNSASERCG
ncbi:monooxygenase [Sphaerosporella brunnea]|uniref:Monooxygenase n=1 Tax=Sphaerosporella brunnea TaxID=1250544 RepID=A0A5J5EDJ5_9PEZI|nr:monooxygenase [Sphaerosporella brunnea]